MKLADLVNLIQSRNYQFEIGVEGKTFKRKSATDVFNESGLSLLEYFKKIARLNKVNTLGIFLFAKNGTSFLRKGFFLVETLPVDDINKSVEEINESVDHINKTVEPINKSVEPINKSVDELGSTHCPIHGVQNQPQMDAYSEILKVRLDHADQRSAELERRNKELERKNDELYNENLRMTRENLTQKDKLELEFQKKEFDLVTQQKSGLNGLMETAQNLPPEAWSIIAGLINPNHSMAKPGQETPALEGAIKKHSDPDAQMCIEMVDNILLNQQPENVGMIFTIVQTLINSPELLRKTYFQFNPSQNNLQVI